MPRDSGWGRFMVFDFTQISYEKKSLLALYYSEQCLNFIWALLALLLPLHNVLFDLVLRCNSLWIKASAKWLNVNVNEIIIRACVFVKCICQTCLNWTCQIALGNDDGNGMWVHPYSWISKKRTKKSCDLKASY